jgi:hypothetical protein
MTETLDSNTIFRVIAKKCAECTNFESFSCEAKHALANADANLQFRALLKISWT